MQSLLVEGKDPKTLGSGHHSNPSLNLMSTECKYFQNDIFAGVRPLMVAWFCSLLQHHLDVVNLGKRQPGFPLTFQ